MTDRGAPRLLDVFSIIDASVSLVILCSCVDWDASVAALVALNNTAANPCGQPLDRGVYPVPRVVVSELFGGGAGGGWSSKFKQMLIAPLSIFD